MFARIRRFEEEEAIAPEVPERWMIVAMRQKTMSCCSNERL